MPAATYEHEINRCVLTCGGCGVSVRRFGALEVRYAWNAIAADYQRDRDRELKMQGVFKDDPPRESGRER